MPDARAGRACAYCMSEQLREQGGQGAKFHPTQPPIPYGPSGQWAAGMGWGWSRRSNLVTVTGPLGSWFGGGGGRARPATGASASSLLPPPRTSGWRPAGKAVRLFGPWAFAADASTCPGMGCNTASHPCQNLSRRRSSKFCTFHLFHNLSWREAREKGSELHDLCGILVRGNYVTNRCLGLGR